MTTRTYRDPLLDVGPRHADDCTPRTPNAQKQDRPSEPPPFGA
ncbi:hypothetical protein AB0O75_05270 [Streptomyces sp. NPDC088921]